MALVALIVSGSAPPETVRLGHHMASASFTRAGLNYPTLRASLLRWDQQLLHFADADWCCFCRANSPLTLFFCLQRIAEAKTAWAVSPAWPSDASDQSVERFKASCDAIFVCQLVQGVAKVEHVKLHPALSLQPLVLHLTETAPTPLAHPQSAALPPGTTGRCAACQSPGVTGRVRPLLEALPHSTESRPVRLRACAGCRQVFYCNDACQRVHWPQHRAACGAQGNSKAPEEPE